MPFHSCEGRNPVVSSIYGFLPEFIPHVMRGRNDSIFDFLRDRQVS